MAAIESKDEKVVQSALRLLQRFLPDHPELKKEIEEFIESKYDNSHPLVQMQMVLTGNSIDKKVALGTSRKFLKSFGHLPVARDVALSSLQDRELDMLKDLAASPEWGPYDQNHEIFVEMLATSIANSGQQKAKVQLQNISESVNDGSKVWIRKSDCQWIKYCGYRPYKK